MLESNELRVALEEIKSRPTQDLKEDHQKIQNFFNEYQRADNLEKKIEIAETLLQVLIVHTLIEDEIIYPVVFKNSKDLEFFQETKQQRYIVELLITQLSNMSKRDGRFDATLKFLGRTIAQRIILEENIVFPRIESLDLDFIQLFSEIMEFRKGVGTNAPHMGFKTNNFFAHDVITAVESTALYCESFL